MNHIGIFTSGGDAPGMNACIRAVVRMAQANNMQTTGIIGGYEGMIKGHFKGLHSRSVAHILGSGGTMLKSSRSEEFRTPEGRFKAFGALKAKGIEAIIAIGGNGTMAGAQALTAEHGIPIIGLPGSIDNDIYGTDFSLGFDTAVNTAVEAIDKIRDTAHSHNRLFFVEVMGRDNGYIALHTALATGAIAVALPELPFDMEKLYKTLKRNRQLGKMSSIVVVAEGCKQGGAQALAENFMNHDRHYDIRVTTLGHIQRGGSPSAFDRNLGSTLGAASVLELLNFKDSLMLGMIDGKLSKTPLHQSASMTHHPDLTHLELIDFLAA